MVYYFYIIYLYMFVWWKVKMNGLLVIKYVSCERYDGIYEFYKVFFSVNGIVICLCILKRLNLFLCESI